MNRHTYIASCITSCIVSRIVVLRAAICCLMAMACPIAVAQMPIRHPVHVPVPADSVDLAYYGKPDYLQAELTVTGINLAVWGFDRAKDAPYSKISLSTIADNFRHGLIWDNDHLSTNMFMHPYHGNLYYNAARSNGLNYWQSGLSALLGSSMWEFIFEREYPSTNDIIATPVGGMAIGEVMFRASDIVLDDRATGWERFGREAAVFAISPMRSLTRIINGDAWRHRNTTGRMFGIPDVAMEISAGARWLHMPYVRGGNNFGGALEVNLEYGDRFELRSTMPYDYFRMRLDLNVSKGQPVISQLNIMGRLISREIIDTDHNDMSIGLYQHYDFYDSDTINRDNKTPYRLGIPASAGFGVKYRGSGLGNWTVDAYTHMNAIFLGGILTDHYDLKDRNYNLASGFSVKSGVSAVLKRDMLSLSASYDYYRMYTWGYPRSTDMLSVDPRTLNAEGDESVAYFGVAEARLYYRLTHRLYLTASLQHYMRSTRYRDFDDVKSSSFATMLMLTYKL